MEEVEVGASEEEEEVVDSEVSMRKMPLNNWICRSMLSVRFFPFRFISLPNKYGKHWDVLGFSLIYGSTLYHYLLISHQVTLLC